MNRLNSTLAQGSFSKCLHDLLKAPEFFCNRDRSGMRLLVFFTVLSFVCGWGCWIPRPSFTQWLNGSFHSSRLPNWGHCWVDFMHEFMMPLFAVREHSRLFPVCPFGAALDNEHIFLDLEEKLAKYFPKEWKQDSGKVSYPWILDHTLFFLHWNSLLFILLHVFLHQYLCQQVSNVLGSIIITSWKYHGIQSKTPLVNTLKK